MMENATGSTPSKDYLETILIYDPETGLFTWRIRPKEHFKTEKAFKIWNTRFSGKPALSANNGNGYKKGLIDYKKFYAHRIAWKMHYGFDARIIDHTDGDRANNRITNLRDVDAEGNSRNVSLRRDNTSGKFGVGICSYTGKWRARIGGKTLGRFETREDAIKIREEAEKRCGFHQNHGRK